MRDRNIERLEAKGWRRIREAGYGIFIKGTWICSIDYLGNMKFYRLKEIKHNEIQST